MGVKFNPFTGNFDFTGAAGGSSGAATIPQYNDDPASPAAQSAWVRRTSIGGKPYGLLLALTQPGTPAYQLSYRTIEGTTVRVTLS